jgi:hypothetical protein
VSRNGLPTGRKGTKTSPNTTTIDTRHLAATESGERWEKTKVMRAKYLRSRTKSVETRRKASKSVGREKAEAKKRSATEQSRENSANELWRALHPLHRCTTHAMVGGDYVGIRHDIAADTKFFLWVV